MIRYNNLIKVIRWLNDIVMNYYFSGWKNYTVFEGRVVREEFWYFFLYNVLVVLVLFAISRIDVSPIDTIALVFAILYSLAVAVPNIALAVRRLHDTSRSGWWLLLGLIPVVGWIILLILLAENTDRKDNQYGSDPKAIISI